MQVFNRQIAFKIGGAYGANENFRHICYKQEVPMELKTFHSKTPSGYPVYSKKIEIQWLRRCLL